MLTNDLNKAAFLTTQDSTQINISDYGCVLNILLVYQKAR